MQWRDQRQQRWESLWHKIAVPVMILAAGADDVEGTKHAQLAAWHQFSEGRLVQIERLEYLSQRAMRLLVISRHPAYIRSPTFAPKLEKAATVVG